jgi:peptide deformylase
MRTIIPQADNPALRLKAATIATKDISGPYITGLIADMKALLAEEKYGVALAASQVGEPVRLFIVSGRVLRKRAEGANSDDAPREYLDQVYINPELVKLSKAQKPKHEGCLSIKGIWGNVPRAEKATVKALDEHGVPFTRGASGLLAHIFQHELDHLDGIMYTDKADALYDDEPDES